MNLLELTTLGFGVVGAVVLGNRATKLIKDNGGSTIESIAGGTVVSCASLVVLPVTAVAGAAVACEKGYEAYKLGKHKTLVEDTKVMFHDAKNKVTEKLSDLKQRNDEATDVNPA